VVPPASPLSGFSRLQQDLSSRNRRASLRVSGFSNSSSLRRPGGCHIAHQLMQEESVSNQIDQAVPVSRVMSEPDKLQIELAQEDLLRFHRGPDGQAPAPGYLLEVRGRRSILLPALRHDFGDPMEDGEAAI
jgi:hypothetical protein